MKRLKTLDLILLTVIMICISSLLGYLYSSGRQSLLKISEEALKFAVESEFDKRFSELNIPFSVGALKDEYKNVEITHESGQTALNVDSVEEKKVITSLIERKVRYTIASQLKECDLHCTDSLWNVQLATHSIKLPTAIKISYPVLIADTIQESYYGYFSLDQKKKLDTYYAGIGDEIRIDAYIDYAYPTVLICGSWDWFSFMLIFTIIVVAFFMVYRHIFKKPNIYAVPIDSVEGTNEVSFLQDKTYKLGNNVMFHPHKQMLVSPKGETELREQLCKILLLLLNAPDYYMKSKDILLEIWGNDTEIGINERLYKNISDLRKHLRNVDSSIRVKPEFKGYRLFFENRD